MDERKEWDEKKEQLERVRKAFRNPDLRCRIPNYLITVLEEDSGTEEILLKMEQVMPKYCVPRRFAAAEPQSLNEGSEWQDDWRSLLFELSPTIREFWAEQYKNYINPNGKYQTLLGFADMRERHMGTSHESSIGLLYSVGWKPVDAMCAYLLSMTTNRMYSLSPDAVQKAVSLDGETAVRLLDKKVLGEAIVHHHPSYQNWWQKIWMEFLYLFCDFQNQEFLHLEHKTKKLKQQCQTVCHRLTDPDYEKMQREQELRLYGLLPPAGDGEEIPAGDREEIPAREPDAAPDKKFQKKQKLALLHAFVCNYQWSFSDWTGMKGLSVSRTAVRNLLWGLYQDGTLQKAFAVREDGRAVDEKGEELFCGTENGDFCSRKAHIGLAHPEELTETQLKDWGRYAKKEKWKQPFPQLKIPACKGKYDLSFYSGTQVTQLYMVTAAGKWGLYQGSDRNRYISYHMADLLHGYGAQLVFDGIWRGPEYGPEIITMEKVVFYRFRHFLLWEHVPESLACAPEELPPRFVSTALAAFRGIIGSGKVEE